jgi:hypothetical protein
MYDSLLGISGALYLSVFEQTASRLFFSTVLERLGGRRFPEGDHVSAPKAFFEESVKC